jgi:hypothetical protein
MKNRHQKLKKKDYTELIEAVKHKIRSTENQNEQISLFTLAHASWTIQEISEFFGVTKYAAAQAVNLKKSSGILTQPDVKISSRHLTILDKQQMIHFYISDEYSRQLPGMKNVISVKQSNGKRIKVQKRLLLLVNINELHTDYKKNLKIQLA